MISACVITRDQQDKLEKCLEHLKRFPMEIVVVDTGSIDDSKKIAEKFTTHVYDFAWINDFAAAKNYAIEKAPTDIVFVVDSDEYVTAFDEHLLMNELHKNPKSVGRVKRTNLIGATDRLEGDEWINRIFDRRYFHYVGRIHEQVERRDNQEYDTFLSNVHMLHDGYLLSEEEKEKKTERNILLLNEAVNELLAENEGVDLMNAPQRTQEKAAYLMYQLGKSYYLKKDFDTAVEYFGMGTSFDLNPKLEFVIDMVETYGYALINSGRAAEALFFENIFDEFGGSADFRFLMGLIYMNNARFEDAIAMFLKATEVPVSRVKGVNSYAAYYNIGVIYECLGDKESASKYYKKSGDYPPAVARLEQDA